MWYVFSSSKKKVTHTLLIALCQDLYDKPQALIPCLHTFCLDCVAFIPRDHQDRFACPICRSHASSFANNFSIQNFIEILENINLFDTMSSSSGSSTNRLNDTSQANTTEEEGSPHGESSSTGSAASSYQSVIK